MKPPASFSEFSQVHPLKKLGWRARSRRLLFAGLLTLTPVALTIFVLVKLFEFMEGFFHPLVSAIERAYDVRLTGLGLIMTLLVVLILGWLSTNLVGRRLLFLVERLICQIPVASSVYSGTKGILEAVSRDQADAFKRVVLIEYPKQDLYALAFVTGNADWSDLGKRLEDVLLVFVPTTPNPTSGFLLLVPRDSAKDLPMTVEEGVRMVISGGILLPKWQGNVDGLSSASEEVLAKDASRESPATSESPESPESQTPESPSGESDAEPPERPPNPPA